MFESRGRFKSEPLAKYKKGVPYYMRFRKVASLVIVTLICVMAFAVAANAAPDSKWTLQAGYTENSGNLLSDGGQYALKYDFGKTKIGSLGTVKDAIAVVSFSSGMNAGASISCDEGYMSASLQKKALYLGVGFEGKSDKLRFRLTAGPSWITEKASITVGDYEEEETLSASNTTCKAAIRAETAYMLSKDWEAYANYQSDVSRFGLGIGYHF